MTRSQSRFKLEPPALVLLDVFCGAGGCSEGYRRAGFHVIGVDHEAKPEYPFEFHQADALEVLRSLAETGEWNGIRPVVVHASPPCHAYSTVTQRGGAVDRAEYPDLVEPVREALVAWGGVYVIENVVGAPLVNPIQLCGSSFGLDIRRHRLFESNVFLFALPCAHHWQTPRFRSLDSRQKTDASVIGVHGHLNYPGELELRQRAMGITWMKNSTLTQAIPPAYTEHIGKQVIAHIATEAAA